MSLFPLAIDVTSTKILIQFNQITLSDRFQQFDYYDKNVLAYNNTIAPDYPLENITSKNIVLIIGPTDFLLDDKDITNLINNLKGI